MNALWFFPVIFLCFICIVSITMSSSSIIISSPMSNPSLILPSMFFISHIAVFIPGSPIWVFLNIFCLYLTRAIFTLAFFKNKFIYLFIFDCVRSSLLRMGFLSSCHERGLLFVAVHRPLIKVASLVAEHRL